MKILIPVNPVFTSDYVTVTSIRTNSHQSENFRRLHFPRGGKNDNTKKHLPNNILKMVGCASVLVEKVRQHQQDFTLRHFPLKFDFPQIYFSGFLLP